MKSNVLQSLARRVRNALAGVHTEIRIRASQLQHNEEWDKPIYSDLSRLQTERKKLEALSKALKQELKAMSKLEAATAKLSADPRFKDMVIVLP